MEELSPIEQLDKFLELFYNSKNDYKVQVDNFENVLELPFIEVQLILDKLIKDKFVIEISTSKNFISNQYQLTFEGKFFIQNGGYIGKFNKEKSELLFTNITTISLIFGGVAAGIYYIFELWTALFD